MKIANWGDWLLVKADARRGADPRRAELANCFLLIIALISLTFALVNLLVFDATALAMVELGVFALVALALVDIRITLNVERSAWVTVLASGGLSAYFYWYVEARPFAMVWVTFFALINFFLLGTRRGLPVYLGFCGIILAIILLYRGTWPALASNAALVNLLGAMAGFGTAAFYQEHSRETAHRRIETLANRDSLTGLSNRRHCRQRFEEARQALCRGQGRYSLILVDIDHFKRVNDSHGHAAGDQVIVAVTRRLLAAVRPEDIVARMGGEEFCVVLLGCDGRDARRRAEALRQAVGGTPVTVERASIEVTISAGVADGDPCTLDFETLFEAADSRLYAAKAQGRNRVVSE
ncbi:GGDEF domain-containing protein [Halomonas koreensis]|uniref:diguanylate cyclase n=1 Tax=Halomonas koreensis TaxID=245385 RepID=A0ABU1FYR8_9GAMM|nr:GGDEF domain-containing protein [Halomonas koreensis]MDR5865837.1 GGDEF domain-containing protein [Halomonas koreensis]